MVFIFQNNDFKDHFEFFLHTYYIETNISAGSSSSFVINLDVLL